MFCLLSYSKACDTLVLVILVHSKHSTHNNCKFLIMKRNSEDVSTETPPKRPYHKYTLEFKMKVINEAKKSANKRKTADANRIDHKLVRNWMNQEGQIKEDLLKCKNKVTPKAQTPFRCSGGGRKVIWRWKRKSMIGLFPYVLNI